jgi:tetratricopeptide (TPR) repeat protein
MVNRLTVNHTNNQIQLLWQRGNSVARTTEPVNFSHPFNAEVLAEIRWYLEEYLHFPYGIEPNKASALEQKLQGWGEELFNLVFCSNEKGRQFFQEATRDGLQQCELGISSEDPQLLNLPWELLYCSDYQFIAPSLAGIYRSLESFAVRAEMKPLSQDRLNILLVIARPYGETDVSFQTIARPLLQSLEPISNRVNLKVLRPPSFEQLERELNANKGFYHIVHFDGHGGFDPNSVGFQHSFGEAGQGVLVFENADGSEQIVTAAQIAQSLTDCQVPLFVLNACRSAQEGNGSFSSVATRLVSLGAKSVVAMSYNVYVVAAKHFIGRLYEQLAMGSSVQVAVAAGRRELLNKPMRYSPKGDLRLQDWIVPILYQEEDHIPFIPTSEEIPDLDTFLDETDAISLIDFPDEGQFGFIGRDYDTLRLERAFRNHNFVLLRGLAGVGKTELACGFGRWFVQTKGVQAAYFASFEQGRGISQVIYQVGRSVWNDKFSQFSDDQQEAAVIKYLKQTSCLLIWDNFESLAGFSDENDGLCSPEEQQALTRFLKALRSGKSYVLITSRREEKWLDINYQLLEISGLARPDAEALGNRILDTAGVNRRQLPPEYLELFDLLGGHPLSLRVVLPHLKTQSPNQLIDALRRGLDTFVGKSEEGRDKSLVISLDYSFSKLSSRTRRHLPFLSLFSTRVYAYWFKLLFKKFNSDIGKVYKAVFGSNLKANEWDKLLNEAVQTGLLEDLGNNIYGIHPVLPWYLRRKLTKLCNLETIQELEKMLLLLYSALAESYEAKFMEDSQSAMTMLAVIEPNLLYYLDFAEIHENWLAAKSILQTLRIFYRFQGCNRKFIILRERALKRIGKDINIIRTQGEDKLSYWAYIRNNEANEALEYYQPLHAQKIIQVILEETLSLPNPSQETIALLSNQLGHTFLEQGEFDLAEKYYQSSLKIRESKEDYSGMAICYENLGNLAINTRVFSIAIKFYKKALKIFKEYNSNFKIAGIYHKLGIILEQTRKLYKALSYQEKALEIYLLQKNLHHAASVYYHIGNIFCLLSKYEKAEDNYKIAMKIYENSEDWNGVAEVYLQLGTVAQDQDLFDEATLYYEKAEQYIQKYPSWIKLGTLYHQWGLLFCRQQEFNEAISKHLKALQIYKENNDEYRAGNVYQALGMIAQQQKQYDEAILYFVEAISIWKKAQDWYKFASASYLLGNILVSQGNAEGMTFLIKGFIIDFENHQEFLNMYIKTFKEILQVVGEGSFSAIWKEVTGSEFVGEIRDVIIKNE